MLEKRLFRPKTWPRQRKDFVLKIFLSLRIMFYWILSYFLTAALPALPRPAAKMAPAKESAILFQTPYGAVPLPRVSIKTKIELNGLSGIVYYKKLTEALPNFTLSHAELSAAGHHFAIEGLKHKKYRGGSLLRIESDSSGQRRAFVFATYDEEDARFQERYGQWVKVDKKRGQWQWEKLPPPGDYGFLMSPDSEELVVFSVVKKLADE